jgi:hypothetical protein
MLKSEGIFPGSDRLSDGMASVEMPPLERDEAASRSSGLRPNIAALCLAGVLCGLVLIVALSGRTQLINNVLFNKSPAFLLARAREIIRSMGYTDPPMDSWHGFVFDDSWAKYVEEHDFKTTRWEPLKTGERPVIGFVYRQSPAYLVSLNQYGVSFDDPPENLSGMAAMILDSQGRLMLFVGVPPQIEEPSGSLVDSPDWSPAFAAAGLDRREFHATAPIRNPPSYADVRAAWEGFMPGKSKIPVRIEAAANRGKPVFFEVIHADDACYTQVKGQLPVHPKLRVAALIAFFGVTLSTGIVVGYRSLQRARSEHKYAFRLALLVFLVTVLRYILFNHHVGSLEELRILAEDLSISTSLAGCIWLIYAVIESIGKARCPLNVTSWNQMLGGHLSSPLVGRDLLIGCVLGVLITLIQCVWNLTPAWLGRSPAFPSGGLTSFAGLTPPIERALLAGDKALLLGTSLFLVFLLLGRLLRKDWQATIVGWMLITAAFLVPSHHTVIDYFFAGISGAVVTFCVTRFGLLSMVFLSFAYRITYKEFSITSHFAAWYAHGTILALVVLIGLAIYGFRTSLGKRPIVHGSLVRDRYAETLR